MAMTFTLISSVVVIDDAMLDATRSMCSCFVDGAFSPDGCCLLLGVFASCVSALLLLR